MRFSKGAEACLRRAIPVCMALAHAPRMKYTGQGGPLFPRKLEHRGTPQVPSGAADYAGEARHLLTQLLGGGQPMVATVVGKEKPGGWWRGCMPNVFQARGHWLG